MNTLLAGAPPANPRRAATADEEFVLPAIPSNISPQLAALTSQYKEGFIVDSEESVESWNSAAFAINEFRPLSQADLAAKLIVAIHFRDPEREDGNLTISAPPASHDRLAVEMELSCVDWLLEQGPANTSTTTAWNDAVRAEEVAWAEYQRLLAISGAADIAPEDPVSIARDAHAEAYEAMLQTPAPDLAAVTYKLDRLARQDGFGTEHVDSALPTILSDTRRIAASRLDANG